MQQAEPAVRLTRSTLRDQAYEAIRQMIMVGRLGPGAPLSERILGEQLGVSRAPVKDALLRLTREGFVVSRPDGRYVKAYGERDLEHMFQVRERLEALAAELAATAITEEKAARLDAELEEFAVACEAQDLDAFVAGDIRIHSTIWEQTGNAFLLNALGCIAAPSFLRVVDCARYVDERWLTPLREHQWVVELIVQGDAAGAGAAMVQHVRSACGRTLRAFREHTAAEMRDVSPPEYRYARA
jgi:DNA-binding GntR family transcriptional regulator